MWHAIVNGVTLGLVLMISVGPVIFSIIKQSLNNGREGGFSFIAGVWLSDILLIFVSNAFSELVTYMMEYRKFLGLVGSVFLLLMGVFYVFFKKIKLQNADGGIIKFTRARFLKIFVSGYQDRFRDYSSLSALSDIFRLHTVKADLRYRSWDWANWMQ